MTILSSAGAVAAAHPESKRVDTASAARTPADLFDLKLKNHARITNELNGDWQVIKLILIYLILIDLY